jgi:hypothetical protein
MLSCGRFKRVILSWPALAVFAIPLCAGFAFAAPSFDGGTNVAFNAEDNATFAYVLNPARLVYYERSTVLMDVGGDWSMGILKYSENGGKVEPGHAPGDPGESASELKVNTSVGGSGLAAFRMGSVVFAFDGGYDWDMISIGSVGTTFPELNYYEGEVLSFSIPTQRVKGIVAFDSNPWAFGFSGKYARTAHVYEDEVDDVDRDELALTDMEFVGGLFYRTNGTRFHAAGGAQMLKNRVESDYVGEPMEGGEVKGMRVLTRAGYRFMPWSRFALGVNYEGKITPSMTVTRDDFDYDPADGSELDVRILPGFAFYPDEQTTLAFDYNVNLTRINVDAYDYTGKVTGEHSLSETWTSTQVGLERWFTEEVAAKAGWRQNIFAYPRNTMFAGAYYLPNENWSFNYDYSEGVVTIDRLSAFIVLKDVIRPGGHRITVTYSF